MDEPAAHPSCQQEDRQPDDHHRQVGIGQNADKGFAQIRDPKTAMITPQGNRP